MKHVRAKVGTQPYLIDIRYKRKIKVGDRIKWRETRVPTMKWEYGLVTDVVGDPAKPTHIFVSR